MPSNYTIVDNFLSNEEFEKVQSALGINTDNFKFPWYYLGKVDDGTLPEIDDHLMFTHMIFAGVQIFSEHYNDIIPIVDKIITAEVIPTVKKSNTVRKIFFITYFLYPAQ